jgi:hypothetical protein
MKEKSITKKEKFKTRSSIRVSSQTVCEDEACIGKTVKDASSSAHDPVKGTKKKTQPAGTSMSVGGKDACSDDACIGKT